MAAQLATLERGGDYTSELSANLPKAPTAAEAAEMLNVSERSVKSARVVRDHGAPELQQKVAKGEVAPSTASVLLALEDRLLPQ